MNPIQTSDAQHRLPAEPDGGGASADPLMRQLFGSPGTEPSLESGSAPGCPPVTTPNLPDETVAMRDTLPCPQVPGYELERVLGRGGMGVTYLALEKALSRHVALKMMLAKFLDLPSARERFHREIHSQAQLKHPNIVTVHEPGEEAGQLYFTMEYIEGGSLEDWVRGTPQPAPLAARVTETLAHTLQHVHEHNFVHRDLKPANVLIDIPQKQVAQTNPADKSLTLLSGSSTEERSSFTAKLTDFGLAKSLDQAGDDTGSDAILGTTNYMPPEQAGSAREAGPAADVYGLGAILYYLLTGRPPFTGENAFEVLKQVKEADPLPPSRLVPTVPRDLETICLKCLRKEPHRRYHSAAALAADVQHFLKGEPIAARPISLGERGLKWVRRKPALAGLLGAVMLLVAGSLVFAVMYADEQQRRADTLDEANKQINQARDNELRQLYAGDLLTASRAVNDGPLSRAIDLLNSWLPQHRGGKDFRGREWHMLRRLCDTSSMTLRGHDGPLRALAWSQDGRLLASGGADRVIRVWDAESGQCLHSFVGHSEGIFDLAFSPNGTLLASASADCTVRVWDVATGTASQVLCGHILPVYAVAFHPDGKQLASGGADCVVKLWDAVQGTGLGMLQQHEAAVVRLQFHAQGKTLASSGIVRGAFIWDLATRQVVDHLKVNGPVWFTPDLATGLVASPNGRFGVVEVKTKTADQGDVGLTGIHAAALHLDARVVVLAGTDDTLHVLDRQHAATLVTHRGHIGPARRLLLRADGRKLASAGDDGTVRLWDLPDASAPQPYSGHHEHLVTAVTFARDGALMASGDYLGSIAVWDTLTGQRLQILGSHYVLRKLDKEAKEVGTGKRLVPGVIAKHLTAYSASLTNKNPIVQVVVSEGHGGEVTGVAITPDKKTVLSAGGQKLILWDRSSGKPLKEIDHPSLVSSLALSPDGTLVATGCWDDIVRIYRVPTGVLVKELEGHGDDVMCVAFDPSGKYLASGSRDWTAIVWDVENSRLEQRFRRHGNSVSTLLFSPDGRRLVTGGMDKAIHIWDTATGHYQTSLHGHTDGVTRLAFSPDGRWLLSASDGTAEAFARVWLWNVDRFREGAMVSSTSDKGPTALAVHPVTGDILLGRVQLRTLDTRPFMEPPVNSIDPVAPEVLRAKAPADRGLKVLGGARLGAIAAWPKSDKTRLQPSQPGHKFLVIAVSLPFHRLKLSPADYQRLLAEKRKDPDATDPLKFSSMLLYPERFVLSSGNGKPLPAQFVGRMAQAQLQGFEFMPRGRSFLECLTATPQPDDRQHVYLAWEVAADFPENELRLRFADDVPVDVPALVLDVFRPGKPFYPATLDFNSGEGGSRLRSQLTRSPGP